MCVKVQEMHNANVRFQVDLRFAIGVLSKPTLKLRPERFLVNHFGKSRDSRADIFVNIGRTFCGQFLWTVLWTVLRTTLRTCLWTTLRTLRVHFVDIALTCCGHCAGILWTLFGHFVDIVRTFCEHCADILWTLCGHFVDIVRTCCGHCADILWTLCGHFVDIVRTFCGHCADIYADRSRFRL